MIKFESLMQAIQQSINSAARSVEANGVRYVNKFFVEVDENGEPIKDKEPSREFGFGATYKPKMVEMAFPSRTPDGMEMVTAEVPLLVLSPLNTPKVEEVKFTADLEVSTNEKNELLVSFDTKKRKGFFSSSDSEKDGNAHLEITIKAGESPEGLKRIIEGYERALRAQIPG